MADTIRPVPSKSSTQSTAAPTPEPDSASSTSATDLISQLSNILSTDAHEPLPEQTETSSSSSNEFQESWFDFLRVKGSVLGNVVVPALVFSCWGVVWTVVYLVVGWRVLFPNSQSLISVISFVVSLILGYRTNAAYDRYWEARKVWSQLVTHCRNLARSIWCSTNTRGNKQAESEKLGAVNLILAFAVSTKHLLREEVGHNYTDLAHLLIHVPKFRPGSKTKPGKNIPLEIALLLTEYVRNAEADNILDATTRVIMNGSIAGMLECLTHFERIRNTPIPLAYAIHLKHILILFLVSLPFQLTPILGWLAIPVMMIASFTLLGIESISNEIEQPFGYDANDLRLNMFCNELRIELDMLTHCSGDARDVDKWDMSVFGKK